MPADLDRLPFCIEKVKINLLCRVDFLFLTLWIDNGMGMIAGRRIFNDSGQRFFLFRSDVEDSIPILKHICIFTFE
jgi:hypothetical protein